MGLVLYQTSLDNALLGASDERVFIIPPRGRVVVANRDFKIVFFLKAKGRLHIDDEHSYDLTDGTLVIFPRTCEHLYENNSPNESVQIHAFRLTLKAIDEMLTTPDSEKKTFILEHFAQLKMVSVLHSPGMTEAISLIRREAEQKQVGWELYVESAIWQFLVSAGRELECNKSEASSQGKARFLIVNKAREFIHKNYHRALTLGEIALYVDRGEEHLAREFKKGVGMTVFQYLRQTRIEAAISLMSDSSYSLTQIASLTGFNTLAFFSRCFRAATGKSPSSYRAQLDSQLVMPEGQNRYEMY